MYLGGFVLLAFAAAGCTAQHQGCFLDASDELLGCWRYSGRRSSAQVALPEEIVFSENGGFDAYFTKPELNENERAWYVDTIPTGQVAGRFVAGRYCAQRLLAPGILEFWIDPPFPRQRVSPSTVNLLRGSEPFIAHAGSENPHFATYLRSSTCPHLHQQIDPQAR